MVTNAPYYPALLASLCCRGPSSSPRTSSLPWLVGMRTGGAVSGSYRHRLHDQPTIMGLGAGGGSALHCLCAVQLLHAQIGVFFRGVKAILRSMCGGCAGGVLSRVDEGLGVGTEGLARYWSVSVFFVSLL